MIGPPYGPAVETEICGSWGLVQGLSNAPRAVYQTRSEQRTFSFQPLQGFVSSSASMLALWVQQVSSK